MNRLVKNTVYRDKESKDIWTLSDDAFREMQDNRRYRAGGRYKIIGSPAVLTCMTDIYPDNPIWGHEPEWDDVERVISDPETAIYRGNAQIFFLYTNPVTGRFDKLSLYYEEANSVIVPAWEANGWYNPE